MKLNTTMINDVLSNSLDLRIATGLAYLLNLHIKCVELNSIENRLDEVEKKVKITVKLPEGFNKYNYN